MSSQVPCAACKAYRRKCTSDCIFASYFPPDQSDKFAIIHNVYGGSNVANLLQELSPHQREGAVNSLVFEASCRIQDPVYGAIGIMYLLQQEFKQVKSEISNAKREKLGSYIPHNVGNGGANNVTLAPEAQPRQFYDSFYLSEDNCVSCSHVVCTTGFGDSNYMFQSQFVLPNQEPQNQQEKEQSGELSQLLKYPGESSSGSKNVVVTKEQHGQI